MHGDFDNILEAEKEVIGGRGVTTIVCFGLIAIMGFVTGGSREEEKKKKKKGVEVVRTMLSEAAVEAVSSVVKGTNAMGDSSVAEAIQDTEAEGWESADIQLRMNEEGVRVSGALVTVQAGDGEIVCSYHGKSLRSYAVAAQGNAFRSL
jgi:hypothetical protein